MSEPASVIQPRSSAHEGLHLAAMIVIWACVIVVGAILAEWLGSRWYNVIAVTISSPILTIAVGRWLRHRKAKKQNTKR